MEIKLNNEIKLLNDDSLQSLINEVLGDKTKGVAVAVNQQVVPRNEWNQAKLKQNDDVMIIKATQGG